MFLILPTPNPRMGEFWMSWGHLLYTLLAPGNKCLSKRGPWAWMAWPWATKRGGGVGGGGGRWVYPFILLVCLARLPLHSDGRLLEHLGKASWNNFLCTFILALCIKIIPIRSSMPRGLAKEIKKLATFWPKWFSQIIW